MERHCCATCLEQRVCPRAVVVDTSSVSTPIFRSACAQHDCARASTLAGRAVHWCEPCGRHPCGRSKNKACSVACNHHDLLVDVLVLPWLFPGASFEEEDGRVPAHHPPAVKFSAAAQLTSCAMKPRFGMPTVPGPVAPTGMPFIQADNAASEHQRHWRAAPCPVEVRHEGNRAGTFLSHNVYRVR